MATKYGFYTKADMAEMRERVLPLEALDDRTVSLIPLLVKCLIPSRRIATYAFTLFQMELCSCSGNKPVALSAGSY